MSHSDLFLHIIPRKEAKQLGLKRYFTGKPCKYGHIDERKVCDWMCMSCNRDKYKLWLAKNRDKKNKQDAQWRSDNSERHSETCKSWKARNSDRNTTITKDWRRKNHSHVIAYNATKRVRVRMAIPEWSSSSVVAEIYAKAKSESKEVDHIVPLTSDFVCGLHCEGNMQLLTRQENASKKNYYWPDMPDTKDPELLTVVREFKN